jgi:hypothetical protein
MEYTARGLLRASTASVTCSFHGALYHDDIRSELHYTTLAVASSGSACASQMDGKMCSGAFSCLQASLLFGLSGGTVLRWCVFAASLLWLSRCPLELASASRPRL